MIDIYSQCKHKVSEAAGRDTFILILTFNNNPVQLSIIIYHVSSWTDQMVPPEDIEKVARAVLAIKLPRTPDQIRSMINAINNLLSNITNSQDNLKKLQERAKIAQDLLQKAQELKSVSESVK